MHKFGVGVHVLTNISQLFYVTVNNQMVTINFRLEEDLGIIRLNLFNKNVSANGQISWVNKALEHLAFDISGMITYFDIPRTLNAHVHMWNFDCEFQEISLASDIDYNSKDWWYIIIAIMVSLLIMILQSKNMIVKCIPIYNNSKNYNNL